jgi:hypothetical protein
MVMGDMPPLLLDPGEEPRAPRGPFCIPLRTSMRPTIASLDSRADYWSVSTTRLLEENVKIYSAEAIVAQRAFPQVAESLPLTQICRAIGTVIPGLAEHDLFGKSASTFPDHAQSNGA